MDRETATKTVFEYLVEHFEVDKDKVALDANLFADLDLDSIDALDMAGLFESKLGVRVSEDELRDLRTVSDVVEYLLRNAP